MAQHWLHPLTPTTADLVAAFPDTLRGSRVTLQDVLATLGERGLASALLVAAAPQMLPIPVGLSNIVAIPAVLVAVQMAAGRATLWMPAWLLTKRFRRDDVLRAARRMIPLLRAVEVLVQPRLEFIWSGVGWRVVGVFIFIVAVISTIPLPFTGWLPAICLVVTAAGMMERDGLVVLGGLGVGLGAIGVFGLVVSGAVKLGSLLA